MHKEQFLPPSAPHCGGPGQLLQPHTEAGFIVFISSLQCMLLEHCIFYYCGIINKFYSIIIVFFFNGAIFDGSCDLMEPDVISDKV